MLAGMAWSMCSSTRKSCRRGPAPERSLLPSPPSPHHPPRDARGSAIINHEDIPSLDLADRALVDAGAAESSAYESTFSRAVERSVDERHERPLVERDGRGAGALVAARESRGITSPFYRGRGERRRRRGVAPCESSRQVGTSHPFCSPGEVAPPLLAGPRETPLARRCAANRASFARCPSASQGGPAPAIPRTASRRPYLAACERIFLETAVEAVREHGGGDAPRSPPRGRRFRATRSARARA